MRSHKKISIDCGKNVDFEKLYFFFLMLDGLKLFIIAVVQILK